MANSAITFGELFKLYYELHTKERTRAPENTRYFFSAHGDKWKNRQVCRITSFEIQEWVDQLGQKSKSSANRAVHMMSAVINWGIRRGYVTCPNPCKRVEKFKDKSRDRFLLPQELTRFFEALEKEPPLYRDFYSLGLLTGARRGNLLSMRWSDIDLDLAIWNIPVTKNGDSQTIPLSSDAIEILRTRFDEQVPRSKFVFPGKGGRGHIAWVRRSWKRILERAEIDNLRIHDLRRTLASYMAIQGESSYVSGRMLGHKDQRSTAIYARLNLGPVREAMQKVHISWKVSREKHASSPEVATGNQLDLTSKQIDTDSNPKNQISTISSADQLLIEAKILTRLRHGPGTKKDLYQKLGSQFRVHATDLEMILNEMEEKDLITKIHHQYIAGVQIYSILANS